MKRNEGKAKRVTNENFSKIGVDSSRYDDGFIDPEGFNAAISEGSGSLDLSTSDEDLELDDDHVAPFETLPEWDLNPPGKRRAIEVDAFAGIDLRLSCERAGDYSLIGIPGPRCVFGD
ncbi:MAG TPA: hypothetical protein VMR02_21265 [Terracidiphilus sp.]|jgi:hypothetical protein|nr:hypothetical protein [Terracidiphilus sp.]